MGRTYHIRQEDVSHVINNSGHSHLLCDELTGLETEELEETVYERLDPEDFEALITEARFGTDYGTQQDFAYNELARILIKKRILV